MKKVLILLTGLFVGLVIFFALPIEYKIYINSSNYYDKCGYRNYPECTIYENPKVETDTKPFLSAWWSRTSIKRTYKHSEVNTVLTNNSQLTRNTLIGLIPIAAALLYVGLKSKK